MKLLFVLLAITLFVGHCEAAMDVKQADAKQRAGKIKTFRIDPELWNCCMDSILTITGPPRRGWPAPPTPPGGGSFGRKIK